MDVRVLAEFFVHSLFVRFLT
eukprot:COSAG04_NODE_17692_length_461_cov_1.588398_2_plen_20_part_01